MHKKKNLNANDIGDDEIAVSEQGSYDTYDASGKRVEGRKPLIVDML